MKEWRGKNKRKTENDVIGLDDERGLQQVEGESQTTWWMATLDVWTFPGRQRTKEEDENDKKHRLKQQLLHVWFNVCSDNVKCVSSSFLSMDNWTLLPILMKVNTYAAVLPEKIPVCFQLNVLVHVFGIIYLQTYAIFQA